MRTLVFSLGKEDFEIQFFRCSGKGGQNVNKVETGVLIIHPASGARAKSCEERYQQRNKAIAFRKLIATPRFQAWHRAETARRLGTRRPIDEIVEDQMRPENLKIEYNV